MSHCVGEDRCVFAQCVEGACVGVSVLVGVSGWVVLAGLGILF